MSDRDDQPRGDSQPSWPTGNDPDAGQRPRQPSEPTASQGAPPQHPPAQQTRPAAVPPKQAAPNRPAPNQALNPARPDNPAPPSPPSGIAAPTQQAAPVRPGPIRPATPPQGSPVNQPTRAVGLPGPNGPGGPPGQGGRPAGPPGARRGPGAPPPGARPGGPGRPPGPGDRVTDHLPPVSAPVETFRREPDLLTHRDDDYLEHGVTDDEPGATMYDGYDGQGYDSDPVAKRAAAWRWVRRSIYVLIFLGVTTPILVFYFVYQNVTVPDPKTVAFGQAQPVTIYYANGQVMEKLTTGARIFIKSNDIPINVRHAVEAAEDETFETNNGFDVKAIARTVYNQLTGGTGGGSTITQEYIKVATGNNQHSVSRKISEVAEAYKMTKTYTDKNDILAAYLNIVYFGKGAYGIESAARAYYGVTAAQLTPEQAALLAGMIQLPGRSSDVAYQHRRFTYVWGRMAHDKWITPAQYAAGRFPAPKSESSSGKAALPWDRQLIVDRVMDELARNGWSDTALKAQGAQIYTTIQPKAQTVAENSIKTRLAPDAQYMNNQPMFRRGVPLTDNGEPPSKSNPQVRGTEAAALVSANPSNGEIVAYFGGDDPKLNQADEANLPHQPGSSFKPYVFTAGLEKKPDQIGLKAVYDPSGPQTILGHVVRNSEGDSCAAPCTVKDAMTASINTVFYKMGAQVGTPAVQSAAFQAGIPRTEYYPPAGKQEPSLVTLDPKTYKPVQIEGGISIGQYPVRPIDQAQGYATFANNGMYIPLHFVRKVTDISGQNVLYQFNTPAKPAFSSDPNQSAAIARTVSDAMTDVAKSSGYALEDDRPADTKTGTQNYVAPDGTDKGYDSDAWTIGFTPQVVTAVWFGHFDKPGPLLGSGNNLLGVGLAHGYDVFGREEPGAIWKTYMDSYLKDQPIQQFPTSPADIGGSWDFVTNSEAPTDQPSPNDQQQQASQPDTTTQQQPTQPTNPFTRPSGPGGGGGGPGGGGGLPTFTTPVQPSGACDPLNGCPPAGGGGDGGGGGPPNKGTGSGGGG